jgi:hypothetical protein
MMTRGDNPDGLATDILAMANNELIKMKKYFGMRDDERQFMVNNRYRSGILFQDRRVLIR